MYACIMVGDPLLLAPMPASEDGPLDFWASYVKGAARAMTALAVASLVMEHGWPVGAGTPAYPFLHSLAVVWVRRGLNTTDRGAVALENAKLSARGAIRKAHDVITWLGKLRNLQKNGLAPGEIIKHWNTIATPGNQIQGSKQLCLLNLLDKAPDEAANLLLEHVSELGDQICFTDDAFAHKKLLPGLCLVPLPPQRLVPVSTGGRGVVQGVIRRDAGGGGGSGAV